MKIVKPRKERGFAILALTAGLAIIAFLFILGESETLTRQKQLSFSEDQKTYMEHVSDRLNSVYPLLASSLDSQDVIVQAQFRAGNASESLSDIFNKAGVVEKWFIKGKVSNTLHKGKVVYSVIGFWLPNLDFEGSEPYFDVTTGQFTTNPATGVDGCKFTLCGTVSGFSVEQQMVAKAQDSLNEIASRFQNYFRSKYLASPEKDVSINYFKPVSIACNAGGVPADATDPGMDELPCINGWQSISSLEDRNTHVMQKVGLGPEAIADPWGKSFLIRNDDTRDPSLNVFGKPPYFMQIKTTTPWGDELFMMAVQVI